MVNTFKCDLFMVSTFKCNLFMVNTCKCNLFMINTFKCDLFMVSTFKCNLFMVNSFKCDLFMINTFKCDLFMINTFKCIDRRNGRLFTAQHPRPSHEVLRDSVTFYITNRLIIGKENLCSICRRLAWRFSEVKPTWQATQLITWQATQLIPFGLQNSNTSAILEFFSAVHFNGAVHNFG